MPANFDDEDEVSPDDNFPDEDASTPPSDNYVFVGKEKIDEGGAYLLGVWVDETASERLGEEYVDLLDDDPQRLYVMATERLKGIFLDVEDSATVEFFAGWIYANKNYYVRKRVYPSAQDALEDAASFFGSSAYGGITFPRGG